MYDWATVFSCVAMQGVLEDLTCRSTSFVPKKVRRRESESDGVSKSAPCSVVHFYHSKTPSETSIAFCSMLNKLRLCVGLHDSIQQWNAERSRERTSVFLHTLHHGHKPCSPRRTCLQSDGAQGFFYPGQGTDSKPLPLPSTWIATD